jgi:hypothetical protein
MRQPSTNSSRALLQSANPPLVTVQVLIDESGLTISPTNPERALRRITSEAAQVLRAQRS